jgi:hypothetical protein
MERRAVVAKHLAGMTFDTYESSELLSESSETIFILVKASLTTFNEAHIIVSYVTSLEEFMNS